MLASRALMREMVRMQRGIQIDVQMIASAVVARVNAPSGVDLPDGAKNG